MKLAAYPRYKPSGVQWLGDVPEHWELPPLATRYTVELGKMLDDSKITGRHLVRYLRNVDVQWDRIDTNQLPEMDIAPGEYTRYTVRTGDLMVCEGGEVGRTAIVGEGANGLGYQKALHRLRPRKPSEVTRFQYFALSAAANAGAFIAGGNPNTIPHLTAVKLRRHRFPAPPLDEQRAIADFLDRETARLDTLVRQKRELIEKLKEKRTALISRTVTRGLNPNVKLKPSGSEWLGDIPKHWEIMRLKWRARCSSGDGISPDEVSPERTGDQLVPVIGGNGIMGFCERSNCDAPVIVIGRVGALCGNVHCIKPPAWVTDNALMMPIDTRVFRLEYLAAVLRSRDLNELADKTAQPLITGTRVRR